MQQKYVDSSLNSYRGATNRLEADDAKASSLRILNPMADMATCHQSFYES
jgi:hypothetical protein